jgi:murein DD-endopeptidase MepM/ murein hydrolase activator NlpD
MRTLTSLANVHPRAGASLVAPGGRELLELRSARAAAERAGRAAHREAAEAKRKAAARKKAQAAAKKPAQAAARRTAALAHERELTKMYSLPVSGYHLTARFNAGGGLWAAGRHTGLDFAAPGGTPVKAVERGRIVETGWAGAYGWRLIIRHPDGTKTWYCHLATFLRTSGWVAVGQKIARVGSTGNATGPHLHLEVHPGGGGPVDPYPWLVSHGLRP